MSNPTVQPTRGKSYFAEDAKLLSNALPLRLLFVVVFLFFLPFEAASDAAAAGVRRQP